jgi:hypothetical protein
MKDLEIRKRMKALKKLNKIAMMKKEEELNQSNYLSTRFLKNDQTNRRYSNNLAQLIFDI